MGAKDFHKKFVCRDANYRRNGRWIHNIADTEGCIGIDLSGLLHKHLHTVRGAAVFDMDPEVPLFEALNGIMKDLRSLQDRGNRKLILFADGMRHPMKAGEEATRKAQRERGLLKLKEVYAGRIDLSFEDVKKTRTTIVGRRVDLTARVGRECQKIGIGVVGAAFEADWDLVEAQSAGLIDVIVSDDGDLFLLGGDIVVSKLDYKVPRSRFEHFEDVLHWASFDANLCQPFLMPRGAGDYFPKDTLHLQRPSKRARAELSRLSQPAPRLPQTRVSESGGNPTNYMEVAMPERYFEIGLDKVGLLMDGKDCVTDTVRVNSFVSRAQYSDKMHCSAARYIMWVLPCGLSVTCTPLFLGRVSEKALVEYWGGSTYDMLHE